MIWCFMPLSTLLKSRGQSGDNEKLCAIVFYSDDLNYVSSGLQTNDRMTHSQLILTAPGLPLIFHFKVSTFLIFKTFWQPANSPYSHPPPNLPRQHFHKLLNFFFFFLTFYLTWKQCLTRLKLHQYTLHPWINESNWVKIQQWSLSLHVNWSECQCAFSKERSLNPRTEDLAKL